MGVIVSRLTITNEGRLAINDYRNVQRAILLTLSQHSVMSVLELTEQIRRERHEYKYLKEAIFVKMIMELTKENLVRVRYE